MRSAGGSVVECSPATRAARVRFPAGAVFFVPVRGMNKLGLGLCGEVFFGSMVSKKNVEEIREKITLITHGSSVNAQHFFLCSEEVRRTRLSEKERKRGIGTHTPNGYAKEL